jgi:hypothetical protein
MTSHLSWKRGIDIKAIRLVTRNNFVTTEAPDNYDYMKHLQFKTNYQEHQVGMPNSHDQLEHLSQRICGRFLCLKKRDL